MEVILSIKPQFAKLIFEGTKKFEFRRTIFKSPNVSKAIVYASSPISKIIGEFEIDCVLKKSIDDLWDNTKCCSGISKEYYSNYFEGKNIGYAIKIGRLKIYDHAMNIQDTFGIKAPQSFAYVKAHN